MARNKETEKLTISETKTIEYYGLNTTLDDLANTIEKWRKEYGDSANFSIEAYHGYYDSIEVDVEIHYTRLETDAELAKRLAKAEKARETAKRNRKEATAKRKEREKKDLANLIEKHPELAKSLVKVK